MSYTISIWWNCWCWFPKSRHLTVLRRVPLLEQELLTYRNIWALPGFYGVRVELLTYRNIWALPSFYGVRVELLTYRNIWAHPGFVWCSCWSIFRFLCSVCGPLYLFLSFFFWLLYCLSFGYCIAFLLAIVLPFFWLLYCLSFLVLRLLVTPLSSLSIIYVAAIWFKTDWPVITEFSLCRNTMSIIPNSGPVYEYYSIILHYDL